jgi:hypothetical protein
VDYLGDDRLYNRSTCSGNWACPIIFELSS